MDVVHVTADAETFTCNAYLALGEREVLIDAGSMPGVASVIREHTDDLDAVVLTHQDVDHVTMLDEVVGAFGPEVYTYDDHDHRTHALEDGQELTIGDERFEVVYTPGHARDHVCFVSEFTLFSGDIVVHDDSAFDYGSFGKTDRPGDDREQLIRSIRTLLDRMPDEVEHLYAGHGDEFHGDVRDVVETALSRAEQRKPKYPDE